MKKYPLHLINHFNSLASLKKRIQMIYSRKYNRSQLLKFVLMIPMLSGAILLLAFVHPYYNALQVLPTPKVTQLTLSTALPPIIKETPKAPPKPARQPTMRSQVTVMEELAKLDTPKRDIPKIPSYLLAEKERKREIEKEKEILSSSVYFFRKSDEIKNAASQFYLNELAGVLKKHPHLKLLITGHTANWGDEESDYQVLSERRAKAVKKYLQAQGINEKRLITKGYGSTKPSAKNDTEFGKIKNNRVQFVIIKKK